MRTNKMLNNSKIETDCNLRLHPPYVQVRVIHTGRKYVCLNNYGELLCGGRTQKELISSMIFKLGLQHKGADLNLPSTPFNFHE